MSKPVLTKEALQSAMLPQNNCKVKSFLADLDDDSRAVCEEALSYDRSDLSGAKLREFLIKAGFAENDVPGVDAITDHRAGRRPCRCHG